MPSRLLTSHILVGAALACLPATARGDDRDQVVAAAAAVQAAFKKVDWPAFEANATARGVNETLGMWLVTAGQAKPHPATPPDVREAIAKSRALVEQYHLDLAAVDTFAAKAQKITRQTKVEDIARAEDELAAAVFDKLGPKKGEFLQALMKINVRPAAIDAEVERATVAGDRAVVTYRAAARGVRSFHPPRVFVRDGGKWKYAGADTTALK